MCVTFVHSPLMMGDDPLGADTDSKIQGTHESVGIYLRLVSWPLPSTVDSHQCPKASGSLNGVLEPPTSSEVTASEPESCAKPSAAC